MKLLSSFAFKFNLRRYIRVHRVPGAAPARAADIAAGAHHGRAVQVGSIKTRLESAYCFSA
jgi:hypothetical protein